MYSLPLITLTEDELTEMVGYNCFIIFQYYYLNY